MKKSNRFFVLSALAALSFGAAACDDDSSNANTPVEETGEVCTADSVTCDNNTLTKCVTGKAAETKDCAAENKICSNGACVFECTDEYQPTCPNPTASQICENNKFKLTPCATDETCNAANGKCETDPCAKCAKDQACEKEGDAYVCKDTVSPTNLGNPCTCDGADCTIKITGEDLKSVINIDELKKQIAANEFIYKFVPEANINAIISDIEALSADDVIEAPNFFSKNISGCDGIDVPDGMALGCFRSSKITFPEALYKMLQKGKNTDNSDAGSIYYLLYSLNILPKGTLEKVDGVGTLLKTGIDFTSKNGYCMLATIDIDANIGGKVNLLGVVNIDIDKIVNNDKAFGAGGLVSKITVGDHSKAKTVECPAGGQKFDYEIVENIDKLGAKVSANVGFDMCLKACINDEDCRTADGYKCVEIPDGVPAEGQTSADLPKKKACFSQDTIDYFTKMTADFAPAADTSK